MSSGTPPRALARRTLNVMRLLEKKFGIPARPLRKPPSLDMLIATILSQNTNDLNSHRAYRELRRKFPSWADVERAPRRDIRAAIRVGGIADRKSRVIKQVLRTIRGRHGTMGLGILKRLDNDEAMAELLSIKGVGTKTAACVLLFSLGRDVFPVDTHIFRICGRLGLAAGSKLPDKTFERMKILVPNGKAYAFHINLIRFGRTICRSNRPLCGACPLFDECTFPRKHIFKKQMASATRRGDPDFMHLDHV